MAPLTVGLVFSLGQAETQPGEEIRLVGGGPVLGGWDPERAVPLSTDESTYPKWSTAVLTFDLAGPATLPLRLEYKYVRDRRKLGGGVVWEDGIPNRAVCVASFDSRAAWLVRDPSWESLGAVLEPAPVTLPVRLEAGFRRQVSPEWTGRPEPVETGDAQLESELFTPTCRCALSPLACEEARDEEHPPRMAREESGTNLSRRAASSVPECENEEPEEETEPGEAGPQDDGGLLAPASPAPAFEALYVIVGEKPLGEGTFGLVWSCRRRTGSASELRAVKRIRKPLLKPRDFDNLFGRDGEEGEIRMHLRLKHPHIVAMHEVFDAPSIVSLVMECCMGGDLFDLIRASRVGLPEPAAARALRHLLSALEFLHSLRIVHRDVKCENVLCAEQGLPAERCTFKLCDFGFAASPRAPDGQLQTRLGSPDAVAPEVVTGKRYSSRVDCWAAGVLLYTALSATSPFWDKTDTEVLRKVKRGEYKLSGRRWDRISREAKDVVRRLLTYNPAARASASQALAAPWVATAP